MSINPIQKWFFWRSNQFNSSKQNIVLKSKNCKSLCQLKTFRRFLWNDSPLFILFLRWPNYSISKWFRYMPWHLNLLWQHKQQVLNTYGKVQIDHYFLLYRSCRWNISMDTKILPCIVKCVFSLAPPYLFLKYWTLMTSTIYSFKNIILGNTSHVWANGIYSGKPIN